MTTLPTAHSADTSLMSASLSPNFSAAEHAASSSDTVFRSLSEAQASSWYSSGMPASGEGGYVYVGPGVYCLR